MTKVNLERKVATINVMNSSKRCKKKKKISGNTTTNTETSSLVVGVISLIINLKIIARRKDLNRLQCSKAFFVNTFEIAFQTGALQIIQKFF